VHLHWSPATFWRATPDEFWTAYETFREAHPPRGD
jgi:hypothetical protein